MAILPEINPTTDEVKIEDIQVGDPGIQTTAEIERLRQKIWNYRRLLIGKGNALPPAARGVVCDIDVGDAKPIAKRVRKIAPRFREKLSELIKVLLSAKKISYSRSPWASPIVVIVKKNGVDNVLIIVCLTQLMAYPMPLINDLLEDLDKVLWYCSLDLASGFWVLKRSQLSLPKDSEMSDPGRLDGDKVDPRWIRAHRAFETLKSKIASTPILRHFDVDREAVVIVYASDWTISAALVQEYDQIYYPITFVSRTLKSSNELNYSPVEKEVLALLRILGLGYNMLVGRRIQVLTRYSTLAWLFRSTGLQGRLGQWESPLPPWTLEIVKCVKGEEEIVGVIAASITPRSM
ncbi:LOW QUALITY PROTEIN: Reverse transcriptase, partial [Phytophthora palmivora]